MGKRSRKKRERHMAKDAAVTLVAGDKKTVCTYQDVTARAAANLKTLFVVGFRQRKGVEDFGNTLEQTFFKAGSATENDFEIYVVYWPAGPDALSFFIYVMPGEYLQRADILASVFGLRIDPDTRYSIGEETGDGPEFPIHGENVMTLVPLSTPEPDAGINELSIGDMTRANPMEITFEDADKFCATLGDLKLGG